MRLAVYAGTFDPPTHGHLAVIREAMRVFDHIRVLVADNPDKAPLFPKDERVALLRRLTAKMPYVSVDETPGLVAEYARDVGATALVRGVRSDGDGAHEARLAAMNRSIAGELVTVLVCTDPTLSQVSSSALKARARSGADLEALCPPLVAEALIAALSDEAAPGREEVAS